MGSQSWTRLSDWTELRYGKMQQEGILSWTINRRQVCRYLWLWRPSPVIAHWVTCQQSLLQNWEGAFRATRDKMFMKCPPKHDRMYSHKRAMSSTNWHLPRACQWVNGRGIYPLPPRKLNPILLKLLTFNSPGGTSEWSEALCSRDSGRTGL